MYTNCTTQTRRELKIKNNVFNKRQAKKNKRENNRSENGQAELLFILIMFILFILFLAFIFSLMSGDFVQIKLFLQSIFGG